MAYDTTINNYPIIVKLDPEVSYVLISKEAEKACKL